MTDRGIGNILAYYLVLVLAWVFQLQCAKGEIYMVLYSKAMLVVKILSWTSE